MSKARRDLNGEKQFSRALLAGNVWAIRASRTPEDEATCTMCGDFCASRGAGKLFVAELRGTPWPGKGDPEIHSSVPPESNAAPMSQ